jgi:mono/diheme cytochrome c family protein
MKISAIIAAGVLLFIQTVFGSVSAQTESVTGDAENGEQLYFEHACYACHGYTGIGRKNLANNVSGIMVSEEVFLTYLRARPGMNPEVPTQSMPNYSEATLSNADARDIYSYIRTFRDNPPEIAEIPALEALLKAAE